MERLGHKDVEKTLLAFLQILREALVDHGDVHLRDFGSLRVRHLEGYTMRENELTDEEVAVPPRVRIEFSAFEKLRHAVTISEGKTCIP